jgi:hypothetical protein
MNLIKHKTNKQKREFPKLDQRVRVILYYIAGKIYDKYAFYPLVTSCLRTWEEERKLKGSGIHVSGRAVDFNFVDMDDERIDDSFFRKDLLDHVNDLFDYDNGHLKTIIYHNKGFGAHYHLQVGYRINGTLIKKGV